MQNSITAEHICFGYKSDELLHDIHFSVKKGECVAVIGANGAGKSTLIKLLLGELCPRRGSIRLFGQPVGSFRDWQRIGYVPQNGAAMVSGFPATVREVVAANFYQGPLRFASTRARVNEALRAAGMEEHEKQLIGTLSGGQLQRALIARALVASPELLLLDEPVTGIDARAADSLYELLAKLRGQGIAVLMVTHDIDRAVPYIDRALCLEHGSLVELTRAQLDSELHHRHKHPRDGCCTHGKE